jgi:hypothetical protein
MDTDGSDEIVFDERKKSPLPNMVLYEDEVDVIQNPYYGLESENATTMNTTSLNRSMSMDDFHRIKVVDNIYYKE